MIDQKPLVPPPSVGRVNTGVEYLQTLVTPLKSSALTRGELKPNKNRRPHQDSWYRGNSSRLSRVTCRPLCVFCSKSICGNVFPSRYSGDALYHHYQRGPLWCSYVFRATCLHVASQSSLPPRHVSRCHLLIPSGKKEFLSSHFFFTYFFNSQCGQTFGNLIPPGLKKTVF